MHMVWVEKSLRKRRKSLTSHCLRLLVSTNRGLMPLLSPPFVADSISIMRFRRRDFPSHGQVF